MLRLKSSEIASFLKAELLNGDDDVLRADDLQSAAPGGFVWVRSFSAMWVEWLERTRPALVLCGPEMAGHLSVPCIVCANPRISFLRVLDRYFREPEVPGVHPTAIIDSGASLGDGVIIGPYARIGGGVRIGAGSVIGSGVVLEGQVTMGRNCRVKPNSVIGAQGFGFEWDDDGTPLHFPHIGRVVMGDRVWIGSCSTIERAGLGATVLEDDVKVDDHVQIGHNTVTRRGTLVMANVVFCGGAEIGEKCWIAPNSVIKQKVKVGRECVVGLGSVVLKDVPDGVTVAGVPARQIKGKE